MISIIYNDTIPCLKSIKDKGYKIAALTDLPTGMPDELFKQDILKLLDLFDLYVSSVSGGFRKPNKYGLEYIAGYFNNNIKDLLFIGDEQKDIQTAYNAGCLSVLIDRKETGKDYGQTYTIKNLFELIPILEKYNTFI